jgi:hypothetical protein
MFAVACFGGGAIGRHHAGVVELVDARDSKTFEYQKILANTSVFIHIFWRMSYHTFSTNLHWMAP